MTVLHEYECVICQLSDRKLFSEDTEFAKKKSIDNVSVEMIKSNGEIGQPCLISLLIKNLGEK